MLPGGWINFGSDRSGLFVQGDQVRTKSCFRRNEGKVPCLGPEPADKEIL